MKNKFVVLKNEKKVVIELTRDSVCAADDFNPPHKKKVTVYSFIDPAILVKSIYTDYLPSIYGYGHTWDCFFNDEHIATIKINEVIAKVSEVIYKKKNSLHFKYNSATY